MRKFIKYLVRHIPRKYLIRFSAVFSNIICVFYKGTNYQCPICKGNFRKFLPYGNKGWDNRLCPKCLSLERHRLIWLYLKDKTDFFKGDLKFLHIAPEQPFIKRIKELDNINYTTADLESPIADVKLDIRDIPFEDNTFDVLMCNHVLEHIEEEQLALQEIKRVLKPGGWAILQVPLDNSREVTFEDLSIKDPQQREKLFGQYDHVRVYGRDYKQRLEQSGLQVDADDYVQRLETRLVEKFRLDRNELIYKCTKK